jgi:hypothetical protein
MQSSASIGDDRNTKDVCGGGDGDDFNDDDDAARYMILSKDDRRRWSEHLADYKARIDSRERFLKEMKTLDAREKNLRNECGSHIEVDVFFRCNQPKIVNRKMEDLRWGCIIANDAPKAVLCIVCYGKRDTIDRSISWESHAWIEPLILRSVFEEQGSVYFPDSSRYRFNDSIRAYELDSVQPDRGRYQQIARICTDHASDVTSMYTVNAMASKHL